MDFFKAVTSNEILIRETFDILKNKIKNFDSDEDKLLREIYPAHEYLYMKAEAGDISEEDCINIFKSYDIVRFTVITKWIIVEEGPLAMAKFHNLLKNIEETEYMTKMTLDAFKDFKSILNNKKELSKIENFKMIESYEKEFNNFGMSIFQLGSNEQECNRQKRIFEEVKKELGV